MANIEQNICDAIEVITNNIVSKAGFDRTIQATIISCVDETTGKYKVKYQDNTFYAYSNNIDRKYSKNNRVYILIPGNDMTRDKTILGTVGKTSKYSATEAGTFYKRTSPNFINRQNTKYQIYSGTEYNYSEPYARYGKEIYNYNHNGLDDINMLASEPILEYMKNSEYICLGAKFKTNLPQDIIQGEYGINVFILCEKDGVSYTYIISLDFEHGIIGEPYDFYQAQYRDYSFLKPDNFVRIEKIEIFAKDFETQLDNNIITESSVTEDMYDIEVTELQIYAANKVDYTNVYNGINIISPKGIMLLNTMQNLPIEAEVVEQGNILNPETNKFYWFKKDASVNSITLKDKYCDLSGLGWACLNEKDAVGNWVPASNAFEFNFNHLTAYENKFKVISYREVATQIVRHEKEFVLWNYNENTKITITSNKNNESVLRSVEDLNLTCNVVPVQAGATYEYYWNAEVNNMSWMTHTDIKNNFDCVINNNQINNIKLKKLNETHKNIIFTCTVIKVAGNNKTILGTGSINLVIENQLKNPYILELLNGNKIFQYNELGEAPTINGIFQPEPLTVQLIDNETNQIVDLEEAITSGKMTIEWDFPEDATLLEAIGGTNDIIVGDGEVYHRAFEYTLKSPFTYEGLSTNKITVKVVYNDIEFIQSTNFTFLTQGDSGTNGTQYSARIIPDTDNDNTIPRWAIFSTTGGANGSFNFGPTSNSTYTMDASGCYGDGISFPFKVQLLRNGEIIYDGKTGQAGNSSQSAITVTWNMQLKNYSSGIKDKSNYQVIQPNGSLVLTMKYIKTMYDNNSQYNNSLDDLNHTPANILKCSIKYIPKIYQETEDGNMVDELQNNDYIMIYATLPIVTVVNTNGYSITLNDETGFSEVVYNRDACLPKYDSTKKEFEINFNGASYNYSNCKWYIKGYRDISLLNSNKYEMVSADNLTIDPEYKYIPNKKAIIPVYKFNGDSVTNAILFKYENASYIHIPIDLHLNRFGLRMLNEWDGTSIEINNDGGYILAPQIGAGTKDNDNKFTGILMGEAKENAQRDMHPGLFAYNKSERTFALMADSGICSIGKPGGSQIILDPSSNRGCIYSGEFFKQAAIDEKTGFVKSSVLTGLWRRYAGKNRPNKAVDDLIGQRGLLIDFTEGRIYSASGKFDLDENGNMICLEGHFSNKYERWYEYNSRTGNGSLNAGHKDCENYFVDLGKYDNSNFATKKASQYFLYCRPEQSDYSLEKVSFSVTKDGELFSNSGEIGGFKINATNITSYDIEKSFDNHNKSVITLSNEAFTRNRMNVVTPYKGEDQEFLPSDWENLTRVSEVSSGELIEDLDDDTGGELLLASPRNRLTRGGETLLDDNLVDDLDDNLVDDLDDSLFLEELSITHTLVRNIKIKKNQQVSGLLIAVGDDFGVTEEGVVYSREIYSRRACFEKFICKNLVVDADAIIAGNLHVTGDLYVEGNLKAKDTQVKSLITEGDLTAKGKVKVGNNLSVEGELSVDHDFRCSGDVHVRGDNELYVYGTENGVSFSMIYQKIMSNNNSGGNDDILG